MVLTRNASLVLTLLTCAGFAAVPADAQVQWMTTSGGNDHLYQFVATAPGIFWSDAEAQAAGMTFQGQSGYLATITSAAEEDFIAASFPDALSSYAWLGGYQPAGSAEPDGGWRWITGETWSYTNWSPGEPNNYAGIEDKLQFKGSPTWNDCSNDPAAIGIGYDQRTKGFLVEYNAPVPEASSVVPLGILLLLGGAGIWQAKRRKIAGV